ncbi:MAG: RimK family alpha-L-glutamate ligase [Ilumatobacter sp.]
MLGLVTADVAAPLDPDLEPLRAALAERLGAAHVAVVSWDDPTVDWSSFSALVVRSTWDYTDRLDEFLGWVDAVSDVTTLLNGADAIRWSADKRYLGELEAAGVGIVPTTYVAPGDPVPAVDVDAGVHVVKPTVGAGSSGARRCAPSEVADHIATLHAEGRTAMVQPYLELLDRDGEVAHCYVVGGDGTSLELSHAFNKGAILTSVEVEQEGGLFAKEEITAAVPSDEQLATAQAALATGVARSFDDVVFARVDVAPVRLADGSDGQVVMEVELIEPSFYFVTVAAAGGDPAGRFADGVLSALRARQIDVAGHAV